MDAFEATGFTIWEKKGISDGTQYAEEEKWTYTKE